MSNKWKEKRVLVTGGTGLLGSHLTRKLVDEGAEVVSLVRDFVPQSLFFSDEPEWRLNRKTIVVQGDVQDASVLERVLNEYEIDSIFHLAAQTLVGTANRGPVPTLKANIQGTWNILEAARLYPKYVERVVVASSDKAYGNLDGKAYNESFPLNGEHPYDVSKSCADLISRMYYVSYGIPAAVTRCGNFFGPGDLNFSRLIPGTIRDVLRKRRPVIRSDGRFIRDYLYVEDGVHAYLSLAEAMTREGGKTRFAGEAFNFSYGLRLTVVEVATKILEKMGKASIGLDIRNEATNEILEQCLDSAKARDLLKWQPKVGFEEGLNKTIDWYQRLLA